MQRQADGLSHRQARAAREERAARREIFDEITNRRLFLDPHDGGSRHARSVMNAPLDDGYDHDAFTSRASHMKRP